jgi:hypothetical protein
MAEVIQRGRAIMKGIDRLVAADVPGKKDRELWKEAYRIPRKRGRPRKKRAPRKPPSEE